MLKHYLKTGLLAAALFWGTAFASAPEADALLWKISRDGQTAGYLAGTMHLGRADDDLPKGFQAALQETAALVVETELVDDKEMADNPQMLERMIRATSDPQGRPLVRSLGKARLNRINRMLKHHGNSQLNGDAPMALWMVQLGLSVELQPQPYSALYSVDKRLKQLAEQSGKNLISLETPEVLSLFHKLPEKTVLRSIDLLVAYPKQTVAANQKMIEFYRKGQTRALWQHAWNDPMQRKMSAADRKIWRDFTADVLIKQRNENWLPKLTAQLQQQPSMIAVGTLHLFGEHGLITLLRQQGYTVTPIPSH